MMPSEKNLSPRGRPRTSVASPIRPILLKRLDLRCGDWIVRELRVNRHLQSFDREQPHSHLHGQLLLYLRGRGEQRIGDNHYSVAPGAVFFIPPGIKHTFLEHSPRLAICLVADLSGNGPLKFGTMTGWLPAEELARVRERVNQLSHDRAESSISLEFGIGGIALLLLESCRRACLVTPHLQNRGTNLNKRLLRALSPGTLPPPPGELARRVGLQQDYLNRLVRRSTGLTLGQWRDRELLKASEQELSRGGKIQDVAFQLGFSDANYFARWFRRQTGMAPKSWQSRKLK